MLDHQSGNGMSTRKTSYTGVCKIELYKFLNDTKNYFDTVSVNVPIQYGSTVTYKSVHLYSQSTHNIEMLIYLNCQRT